MLRVARNVNFTAVFTVFFVVVDK